MKKRPLICIILLFLFISCNLNQKTIRKIYYEEYQMNIPSQIRGVSVLDSFNIILSGSKGAIFLTNDGGKNWKTIQIDSLQNNQFRDIEFIDKNIIYTIAITKPAVILKSENGGQDWIPQYSDTTLFLDAIDFYDNNTGIAIADPVDNKFVILKTTNGGKSWIKMTGPESDKNESLYAASGTCLIVRNKEEINFVTGGESSRILRSFDQGKSWTTAKLPIGTGEFKGAYSVDFYNDKSGVVVGGNYNDLKDSCLKTVITSDSGKTWQALKKGVSGFREVVKYVPGTNGNCLIAIGPDGADYSNDGGKNWTQFPVPEGLHCLDFSPDGKTAFAGGNNGKIIKLLIEME